MSANRGVKPLDRRAGRTVQGTRSSGVLGYFNPVPVLNRMTRSRASISPLSLSMRAAATVAPPSGAAKIPSPRAISNWPKAISRSLTRSGKVWIRMFPDKPVTVKPAETRMGKGKGAPEYWVTVIKPGRIMFEIEGVARESAKEALRLAGHKLPIKTRFIERRGFEE